MVIIQLTNLSNQTLSKLLNYASAANVNVAQLVEEIIEDAMVGNDIPGVLLARSERLPGGVGMADALASAFKNAKSPVEVAEQILAPEVSKEAQSFLEPPTPSEQNMEDWLQQAYKKINDLPTGSVFIANQFAPTGIDANTSRVFGRKLLHLLTKAKLYSSKKRGKSCTEYIRS